MKIFAVRFGLMLLFFYSLCVGAQEEQGASDKPDSSDVEAEFSENYTGSYHVDLREIKDQLSNERKEKDRKLIALERLIKEQAYEINNLGEKISGSNRDDSMTFEEWTGILLASVAIILTVLALVIAIVSFYGYKKIISSSNEIATIKATEITGKIVNERIHETTKVEIVRLFEDEKLDDFLLEAAGKVIYRGIGMPNHEVNSDDSDKEGE